MMYTYHSGAAFSTRDADHGMWSSNCAASLTSGAGLEAVYVERCAYNAVKQYTHMH